MTAYRLSKHSVLSFSSLNLNASGRLVRYWYVQGVDESDDDLSQDTMKHFFTLKVQAAYSHKCMFFQTAEVNDWGRARGPLLLSPKKSYTTFLWIIHWWNYQMHCLINLNNIVFSSCSHISLIFKKYLLSSFASQI